MPFCLRLKESFPSSENFCWKLSQGNFTIMYFQAQEWVLQSCEKRGDAPFFLDDGKETHFYAWAPT